MKVHTEPNCGNAPRQEICRRFAVALASSDVNELESLLSPEAQWALLGRDTYQGISEILTGAGRASTPAELTVLSVITHGREACIDGEIRNHEGIGSSFCHVLRFANTAKTAPIVAIRTYSAS